MNSTANIQLPPTIASILAGQDVQFRQPTDLNNYQTLMSTYLRSADYNKATDIVEELTAFGMPDLACKLYRSSQDRFDLEDLRCALAVANALHFNQETVEAEKVYLRAAEICPTEPSIFTNIAILKYKLAEISLCKANLLTALELNANHTSCWELAARLFQEKHLDEMEVSAWARQTNSWMGQLFVAEIKEDSPEKKIALLKSFLTDSEPSAELLIEITGQMGSLARFDDLLKLVWQYKSQKEVLPWQVLLHASQSALSLNDFDLAQTYLQDLENTGHPESLTPILAELKQEIKDSKNESH